MRLDRNINPDGRGKYALVLLRNLPTDDVASAEVNRALHVLQKHGVLDHGDTPDSEFFLIRLKDKYAEAALHAYANAAHRDDQPEWGYEIDDLASKARSHSSKKQPD